MFALLVVSALDATAADVAPAPEARALYTVLDPALDGNGPGGGLFVEGRGLGAVSSSLTGTAVVGWTVRPLRLALVFPADVGADRIVGRLPRIDLLFVLHDRKNGGLGVAGGVDTPLPFVRGDDRAPRGRIALAVGKKDTVVSVNLGAPIGPPLEAFTWAIGGALPLTEGLGAFAELDGMGPIGVAGFPPTFGAPAIRGARSGLHLAPRFAEGARPLVLSAAVGITPDSAFPSLSLGAAWIPPHKARRPRTEGADGDRDRVADAVDACPREREDFDGGNDADGCPDGGARTPPTPDVSP
jgi:hypothetical protein